MAYVCLLAYMFWRARHCGGSSVSRGGGAKARVGVNEKAAAQRSTRAYSVHISRRRSRATFNKRENRLIFIGIYSLYHIVAARAAAGGRHGVIGRLSVSRHSSSSQARGDRRGGCNNIINRRGAAAAAQNGDGVALEMFGRGGA